MGAQAAVGEAKGVEVVSEGTPGGAWREALLSEVLLSVSVTVSLSNPLGPHSPLEVTSLAASEVQLQYQNETVAVFALPPQAVAEGERGGSTLHISAQARVRVSDDGFGALVSDFIRQDAVAVLLRAFVCANVSTAIGHLSLTQVPITQRLLLPGAAAFPDVEVLAFDVSGGGSKQVLSVWVRARVRNRSNLAAKLGAVSFALLCGGEELGQVSSTDLDIAPGSNDVELAGAVLPQGAAAEAALGDLVGGYLRGEVVEASVRGLSASGSDAAWLQQAVSSLRLSVPLQWRPSSWQPLLQDIALEGLGIRFAQEEEVRAVRRRAGSGVGGEVGGEGGGQVLLLTAQIQARLVLPFSVIMEVERADLRLWVSGGLLPEDASAARPFALLDVAVDGEALRCDTGARQLNITLKDVPLEVLDQEAWGEFVGQVFNEAAVSVAVNGSASVTAVMQFGRLRVARVPVAASVVSRGMAGLRAPRMQVAEIAVYPAAVPQQVWWRERGQCVCGCIGVCVGG